jgi:hypothetical protein
MHADRTILAASDEVKARHRGIDNGRYSIPVVDLPRRQSEYCRHLGTLQ